MKRTTGAEETALSIACLVWSERKRVCIEVRKEVRAAAGAAKAGRRSCFFGRVVSIFGARIGGQRGHTLERIVLANMLAVFGVVVLLLGGCYWSDIRLRRVSVLGHFLDGEPTATHDVSGFAR